MNSFIPQALNNTNFINNYSVPSNYTPNIKVVTSPHLPLIDNPSNYTPNIKPAALPHLSLVNNPSYLITNKVISVPQQQQVNFPQSNSMSYNNLGSPNSLTFQNNIQPRKAGRPKSNMTPEEKIMKYERLNQQKLEYYYRNREELCKKQNERNKKDRLLLNEYKQQLSQKEFKG